MNRVMQPDTQINLRVLERRHNRADKLMNNARAELIDCLINNEESFHRWAVTPYPVKRGLPDVTLMTKKPADTAPIIEKQVDFKVDLQTQSQDLKQRIKLAEAERSGDLPPPDLLTSEFLFPRLRTGSQICVCTLPTNPPESTI